MADGQAPRARQRGKGVGRVVTGRAVVGAMPVALAWAVSAVAVPATAQSASPSPEFEAVLSAPDDTALNLAYARAQLAGGQAAEAAGTLERLLLLHPEWDSARLLLAAALFNLDDTASARREAELLQARPLTPDNQEALDVLLARLSGDAPRRSGGEVPRGLQGRLLLGAGAESDAGGVFAQEVFRSDQADAFARAEARLRYAFGLDGRLGSKAIGDGGTTAWVGGTAALRRFESVGESDTSVYGLEAGLAERRGPWQVAVRASFDRVEIGGTHQLDRFGARLQSTRDLGALWGGTLRAGLLGGLWGQRFQLDQVDAATGFAFGDPRTGPLGEGGARLLWGDANTSARLEAAWQAHDARSEVFSFNGPRAALSLQQGFGERFYGRVQGSVRHLDFDADDFRLLEGAREDTFWRGDAALGWRFADGLAVEAQAHHLGRASNIPAGDFQTTGGELRLVADF